MKNKKLIIGIICGIVLAGLVVVMVLLLGTTKPQEEVNEQTSTKKLNETRTFEGYEFKDAKVKEHEGQYVFEVQVTNKTAKEEATRIVVTYYGADEKELGAAVCMIPKLAKDNSVDFNCSCDIKEILSAVDYNIIATEKEIHDLKQS